MKFQINNKGSVIDIALTFRCGWAGDYTYHFTHNVEHASYAGLLAETLDEQFASHIKLIRKAAYNEGWEGKINKNAVLSELILIGARTQSRCHGTTRERKEWTIKL